MNCDENDMLAALHMKPRILDNSPYMYGMDVIIRWQHGVRHMVNALVSICQVALHRGGLVSILRNGKQSRYVTNHHT